MKDQRSSIKEKVTNFTPIRVFGRALNWVGNGAKTVVQTPLKAKPWQRKQAKAQPVTCDATAQLVVQDTSASGGETTLQAFANGYADAVQSTQQRLSSQLQDSAEYLRKHCLPFQPQGNAGFLAANCFPQQLVARKGQKNLNSSEDAQHLVSTGSRDLLRIRLYDFAVYLDRRQARQSQLGKQLGKKAKVSLASEGSELEVTRGIRDSKDIEMSLMVRAARNLPIRLLAKEYERILKRRLRVVGGSPNDKGLRTMLQQFREEALPEDIRQGGSVRKGTVISFTRDWQGNIRARANDHDLVTVTSPKLAQAVFDIYLGDQVVSAKARRDAGDSFIRMLDDSEFTVLEDQRVCTDESCRVGKLF